MGHPTITKTPEQLQREKEEAKRKNHEIAENLAIVEELFRELVAYDGQEIDLVLINLEDDGSRSISKVTGLLSGDQLQYEKHRLEGGARDARIPILNDFGYVDEYPVMGVRSVVSSVTIGFDDMIDRCDPTDYKEIWRNCLANRFGPIGLYKRNGIIVSGVTSD
ncbi:hypothetical protein CL614_01440 [archaeon]|nr:hypothetical protein [archaeon]|tara:strand:+ start:2313 stop:2804 length:492 start_codon:yes stop_codon:yes gene_type:complete